MVLLGMMLAFLPEQKNSFFRLKPDQLSMRAASEENIFTVDQVARFLNNEDTTIQLIDVRSPEQFRYCNIPGSVNIPVGSFLDKNRQGYLDQNKVRNIFYSNGDLLSAEAWTIATGLGFRNNFIMKGGLNEWFRTVMNSEFKGETISARENALFENRFRAKKLFTSYNSLPDSLKIKMLVTKQSERAKLDGGCE